MEHTPSSTPAKDDVPSRAPAQPGRRSGSPVLAGIIFVVCAGLELVWNPPLLILAPLGLLILLAFLRLRTAAIVMTLLAITMRIAVTIRGVVLVTGHERLDSLGLVFVLAPHVPQVLLLFGGLELLRRGLFLRDDETLEAIVEPSSPPQSADPAPTHTGQAHRVMDRLAWIVLALVVVAGIVATVVVLVGRSGSDSYLRLDSPEQTVTFSDGSKVAVAIRAASQAEKQLWLSARSDSFSLDGTRDVNALVIRNQTPDRLRLQIQLYALVREQGGLEYLLFIGPELIRPADFDVPDDAAMMRIGRLHEVQLSPGQVTARPIPSTVSQELIKIVHQ